MEKDHEPAGCSPRWVRGPILGRGSTATVSLSFSDGKPFAVKSAELRNSFSLQREQRLLRSITSPHVVSYMGFDVTREGGKDFYNLFLEYAAGGSLSDHIHGGKGLVENEIKYFARSILMGLYDLHSHGIAHCDVKPRNVLLFHDGSVKIADLGCARRINNDDKEEDSMFAGMTLLYMSPEVGRGEVQGAAADVWALGCSVIEMATGRPPWPDVKDVPSAVYRIGFSGETPEIPRWMSPEARDFVKKCLAREVLDRPTAGELLRHAFVADAGPVWSSPKCVLDLGVWDSMDAGEGSGTETAGDSGPTLRLAELQAGSVCGWADEDDGWISVRT